jgi:uncharacterized protein with HEPN domain
VFISGKMYWIRRKSSMSVNKDQIRLRHMLDAARQALAFADGKTRGDLDDDILLVYGVVKAVEIVGEAASRISKEYQTAQPKIPWSGIIAMRNVLIHDDASIELDEVWKTLLNDLPALIA